MDPALDPPPIAAQTAVAIPGAAPFNTAAASVNPTPVQLVAHNHPPYAEMISAAITALKDPEGSSKRAIAKYIETHYTDLPPTHSDLLTHHLKLLKTNGQLLMVKHSYTLPGLRSAPPAVNGAVNVESANPAPAVAKRRPGRPPKSKPDAVQVAVPVFPPINMNDVPIFPSEPSGNISALPENTHIAAAPANGAAAATPVRGRGRPPKQSGGKRGPGRPPKSGGGSSGRGRGRPRKNSTPSAGPPAAPAAVRGKSPGRPRGRPPKPINVVGGFVPLSDGIDAASVGGAPAVVETPVTGKRRGRPPKAGNEAKKPRNMSAAPPKSPRKLSGKPLGRPRKTAEEATVNRTPDSQLLVAYLDLKAKLENLQSMVKQTATLIRPSLNNEVAINAVNELEFVAVNSGVPPNFQAHQQQQPMPEQVQPQS